MSATEQTIREVVEKLPIISRSGKLVFGADQVAEVLSSRRPKAVVVSRDAPVERKEKLLTLAEERDVPALISGRTNREIGSLCGRPHVVSALAVLDYGDVSIS